MATPRLLLTDAQWTAFRARIEETAANPAGRHVTDAYLAEVVLLLMDRIDHLEKRLSA